MSNVIQSNNVEGNNLCYFCANWKKKKFFCTDPTDLDPGPVIVCKYYLPVGTTDFEADLAMMNILEQLI